MRFRNETCHTCAYRDPYFNDPNQLNEIRCRNTGRVLNIENYCSEYTTYLPVCSVCGETLLGGSTILNTKEYETNKYEIIPGEEFCPSCFINFNKCATCVNYNLCSFQTDLSPLPQMVQKEIRQGNMVAVTQIINPERVRITCENGCPCWSLDFSCSKQTLGTCPQYHLNRV